MSIRFGISSIESTWPRLVRCRKLDWTLAAIAVTFCAERASPGPTGVGLRHAPKRYGGKTDGRPPPQRSWDHVRYMRPIARRPGSLFLSSKMRAREVLLDLHLGSRSFELLLDVLGLFLADAFLDRLRSAFDQVLGFFQAECGDLAHCLDDVDLV